MTIKVECFCDLCKRDLSITSNCIDFRISIQSEKIPVQNGAVTLMHIEPPLDGPIHFCGVGCMKKYLESKWS